jgi:hypothetical protein
MLVDCRYLLDLQQVRTHGHDELDEPSQDAPDELDEPVEDTCNFLINLTLPSCRKITYQAR